MDDGAREWEILLVEDNPADIRLTQEAFKELSIRHRLQVAEDGGAALSYLEGLTEQPAGRLPDLILLDINLPIMNGLEVLAVIKSNDRTRSIPVIIMSSSSAESDIATAYRLNANCYTRKPLEIDGFFAVMESIRRFWLETALLPGQASTRVH
jgi:CheY-like chemotaxis protein